MKKIGDITNTADKNGEFTDGNVAAGTPPTQLMGAWFNSVQREILNVLASAGVPQSTTKEDQLVEAIGKLIGSAGYQPDGYSYSKVESNLKFQPIGNYAPAGNYADGNTFKKNADNSSMTSPAGKYSLIIDDNGKLFTWDGVNATFAVSPTGELLVGRVPYSHLTDVSMVQYLGNSDSHFVSQKAVTDAVNGKQAAGNYADGALIHKWTDNIATIVNTPNFGTRFAFYDSGSFIAIDPVTSEGRFGFSGSGELFKGSVPANLVTGLFSQYRNVTSARALGVEYKNASNKPKFVIISHHNNDGSLIIDVNGEQIYSSANTSNGSTRMNSYFIVPPNGTYKVNHMPFYLWSECE